MVKHRHLLDCNWTSLGVTPPTLTLSLQSNHREVSQRDVSGCHVAPTKNWLVCVFVELPHITKIDLFSVFFYEWLCCHICCFCSCKIPRFSFQASIKTIGAKDSRGLSLVQLLQNASFWCGVCYGQHLNAPRQLPSCHGVSLEGGLVRERVAAVVYPVTVRQRADILDWRSF